ncbi:hypothetical protein TgHK011_005065 [Trichoderma gracile]|nr:hypothetical protein TgHK011_005065 [Trichoderma gracile]
MDDTIFRIRSIRSLPCRDLLARLIPDSPNYAGVLKWETRMRISQKDESRGSSTGSTPHSRNLAVAALAVEKSRDSAREAG